MRLVRSIVPALIGRDSSKNYNKKSEGCNYVHCTKDRGIECNAIITDSRQNISGAVPRSNTMVEYGRVELHSLDFL